MEGVTLGARCGINDLGVSSDVQNWGPVGVGHKLGVASLEIVSG